MSKRRTPSARRPTPRTSRVWAASLPIGSWRSWNWTAPASRHRRASRGDASARRWCVWISRGRRTTLPVSIIVGPIALVVAILVIYVIALILIVLLIVGLLW